MPEKLRYLSQHVPLLDATVANFHGTRSKEENIDELKQQIHCTNMELKSMQMAAWEEKKRNAENLSHLLQLVNEAFRERDEAKDQLQRLLNKLAQWSQPLLPALQPESPLFRPTKANSSITESNSFSETYTSYHNSYGSSSVESLFDAVSSPDFQSMSMADSGIVTIATHQPLIQHELCEAAPIGINISQRVNQSDPASAIVDQIATMKKLPEKGKLLQAVMEAGPLLQTLIVAGPLPQWRNPPPPVTFQIPPVSIKGQSNSSMVHKSVIGSTAAHNENHIVIASPTVLNFSGMSSYQNMRLNLSNIMVTDNGKQQRIQ